MCMYSSGNKRATVDNNEVLIILIYMYKYIRTLSKQEMASNRPDQTLADTRKRH